MNNIVIYINKIKFVVKILPEIAKNQNKQTNKKKNKTLGSEDFTGKPNI